MKHLQSYIFLGLLLAIAVSGCTPKVWEIDTRLGEQVDRKTGFRAYYTKGLAQPLSEVRVFVASVDSLIQPKKISKEIGGEIFPVIVGSSEAIIMRPSKLRALLGVGKTEFDLTRPHVEMGTFHTLVQRVDTRAPSDFTIVEEIYPGGWSWGEPSAELESNLKMAMQNCMSFASDYGADAIVDVQVFYRPPSIGLNSTLGIMLYGTAIAYTEDP